MPARAPVDGLLTQRHRVRNTARYLTALSAALLLANHWAVGVVNAQETKLFLQRGFKVPDYDPKTQKLKSLLLAEEALVPAVVTSNTVIPIKGLRLVLFTDDGRTNLTIVAADCLYHKGANRATSPNALEVQTGDGQFTTVGEGFFWEQDSGLVTVSNRVHSVIRRDTTNSPVAAVSRTNPPPIDVFADHFTFQTQKRVGSYRDRVRVDDPEMELTSDVLTVQLPATGGSFETITAEQRVVLLGKADGRRARGDQAVFTAASDTVELTGHTDWQLGDRTGRGDRLRLQRKEKDFAADGNVYFKLPRDAAKQSGAWLTFSAPATNRVTDVAALSFAEVFADHFQSRSNVSVFRDQVRVLDGTNRLSCGVVTLTEVPADGTVTNREQSMLAERDVVLEQGARRVTAGRMWRAAGADEIFFTGQPRWRFEDREGRADALIFNRKENRFSARTNSYVKLRTGGDQRLFVLPELTMQTNRPTTRSHELEIISDDLDFQAAAADFHGRVHATELPATGAQQRLDCGELHVKFTSPSNRIENIVARDRVLLEQGARSLTNYQKLACEVMTLAMNQTNGEVQTMVANRNVEIEQTGTRGTGQLAVYTAGTDVLELSGNPYARTPQVEITGASAILWERRTGQMRPLGMPTIKAWVDTAPRAAATNRAPVPLLEKPAPATQK